MAPESSMRSTQYPRVSRAVICSALLLSQHGVADANNWATGRSRRSSTLAVMQPGGRNRPVRDWKAMKRESEEKLARQAEEKALEKARKAGVVPEPVEEKTEEAPSGAVDQPETASAELLELEEGTPASLGVMLAKVAAITTVGVYGAKKVVAFAKAFIKARKEASEESAAGEVTAVAASNDQDEDEGGDDEADEPTEADGEQQEEAVGTKESDEGGEKDNDEATEGYVTASEDEDTSQAVPETAESTEEERAAEELETTKSTPGGLESDLEEGAPRDEEGALDDEDAAESEDSRARLPEGVEGGKVDVSYV